MARAQHEAVAIDPARFLGVVAKGVAEEDGADVGTTERESDDALFLQSALVAEGIQVLVVPESDLPRVPDHKLFRLLTCSEETLVVYDALERPASIPWPALRLITAGYDQKEIKLELFVGDGEMRFTTSVDRLLFNRMPQFQDPRDPKNIGASFVYLVRDLAARAPHALRNRAAFYLTQGDLEGDITAGITYPRPGAYLEEIIWLLWNARKSG